MRHAILALCATTALAPSARAQALEEVVDSASRLQEAGRWRESRELLGRRRAECGSAATARPCRIALGRALGYAYQREGLLARAVDQYREVLAEAPTDGTALTNLALALRSLGHGAELETLARAAISQDPDNAGFYWVVLGDALEDRNAWAQAAAAYRGAIAAAPTDETPRRQLVEVYRQLPRDSAAALYAIVSRDSAWAVRFPDVAATAYELVVDSVGRRDPVLSRRACLRWITVLADAGVLTVSRLEVVDQQWLGPELDQLKQFIRDPAQLPPRQGLWGGDNGMEAIARAALSLARQHLATGDAGKADAYLQAGLQAGADAAPASLDLALEAAALYYRDSTLDTKRAKFRSIEDRLLSQKAQAYHTADQEAIQRFHTVLGLIYAQRQQWRVSDVPWTNAVFQLEHALGTARRRDAAAGTYQPLPDLRGLLAQGYEATGRRDSAAATYASAAQAYLDLDQLEPAGRMLSRGRVIGWAPTGVRLDALDRLIQARTAASTASGTRPSADQCESSAQQATGSAAGLSATFLKRQRFKIMADCLLAGPADIRPEDAAHVLTAAIRDSVALVGLGDLVRIERSQKVISRTLRSPDKGGPDLERLKTRPSGAALQLQLPTESRSTYIPFGRDALIGAAAVERLGADSSVRAIRVNQGVVTVSTRVVTEADQSRIQAKLQGIGSRTALVLNPKSSDSLPLEFLPTPAQRQAAEMRERAVKAGATDADLRFGDAANREATSLVARGNQAAATEQWGLAAAWFERAARDAAARRGKLEEGSGDSKAELATVLTAYAQALETRNVDAVRRVVPRFDEARLSALFKRVAGLRAELQLEDLAVEGNRARATVTGTLRYRDPTGRVIGQDSLKQRAIFVRGPSGWQMAEIQ